MLVRGPPRARDDTGTTAHFFLSGGIRFFLHLLVRGFRLQDGRQILRKGTADVRLEDDLKIFNPLKLTKLHNRPTESNRQPDEEIEAGRRN